MGSTGRWLRTQVIELPSHVAAAHAGDGQKMQGREESGAAALIRQSGSILDIARDQLCHRFCQPAPFSLICGRLVSGSQLV